MSVGEVSLSLRLRPDTEIQEFTTEESARTIHGAPSATVGVVKNASPRHRRRYVMGAIVTLHPSWPHPSFTRVGPRNGQLLPGWGLV